MFGLWDGLGCNIHNLSLFASDNCIIHFRYQQALTIVPTDPAILKKISKLYEYENDKSQAFQYMYEVSIDKGVV